MASVFRTSQRCRVDKQETRMQANQDQSVMVEVLPEESSPIPQPSNKPMNPKTAVFAASIVWMALRFLAAPALAGVTGTAPAVADLAVSEIDRFTSGLTSSFLLVFASEIGDKTFFISALLCLKYSKRLVLAGTMGALSLMTIISVLIGQIFHALPASLNTTIPIDDYAAVALLVWFGIDNIRSALAMSDEDSEKGDAEEAIATAEESKSKPAWLQGIMKSQSVRVVVETFSLIFVAEWGDKSMLTTIALAAAKNPFGVVLGGISGHLVASIIAVLGGSILSKYITEKNARLLGGVLFLVFAALTLMGLY
eukprot:CAMPEP_0184694264 /NCGR_PEP_ID=MMETSP0313-20130426/2282_1 /TAXON_ID=2792 /ORGANISM="Porphyridium aerugineum, Strain SAG 1380-2" /LENGTH=309 /DNA_ID=CAMNT_0027152529 /DNA_START=288 /DNA_END=1217 /DNA_ORIENTATION=+